MSDIQGGVTSQVAAQTIAWEIVKHVYPSTSQYTGTPEDRLIKLVNAYIMVFRAIVKMEMIEKDKPA